MIGASPMSEQVKALFLKAHNYRFSHQLPPELVTASVREDALNFFGEMYGQLSALVYGQEAEHTMVMHQPATWIEHLKRAHAPAWVLKHWPVRNVTLFQVIKAQQLFPDYVPPRVGDAVVKITYIEGPTWAAP